MWSAFLKDSSSKNYSDVFNAILLENRNGYCGGLFNIDDLHMIHEILVEIGFKPTECETWIVPREGVPHLTVLQKAGAIKMNNAEKEVPSIKRIKPFVYSLRDLAK